jgi:hypothetical protein
MKFIFNLYLITSIIFSTLFIENTQAQKKSFDISQARVFDYGYNMEMSAGGFEFSEFIPIGWSENGLFASYQLDNRSVATPSPFISIFNLKANKTTKIPLSSDIVEYEFSDEFKNQKINEAILKYEITNWGTGKYVRKKELPLNEKYISLKLSTSKGIFRLSAIAKNGQEVPIYSNKLRKGKRNTDGFMEGAERINYVGYFIHPEDPKQILIILMHMFPYTGFENAHVYVDQWIGFRLE